MKKFLGLIIAGGAVIIIAIAIAIISITSYNINGATIWEDMGMFGAKKYKTELTRFIYSSGGGMEGGYDHIEAKAGDDGLAYIVYDRAQWHNQIPEVEEYKVSMNVLKEIEAIFYKHKMGNWEKRKDSPWQVLDADTSSARFYFGEESTGYNSEQLLPKGYGSIQREIFTVIRSFADKGEKIPALVVQLGDSGENYSDTAIKWPEEGKKELYAYYYVSKRLTFRVLNGTEEQLTEDNAKFVLADDKGNVIYEDIISYDVYPDSWEDYYIKTDDYLQPGTYTITLGELETKIEIE